MNTKDLQKITSFAAQTGLKTDVQSGVVYGNFGGYNVTVSPISGTVMFQISVFVSRGGSKPDVSEIENIKRLNKGFIASFRISEYRVDFNIKQGGLSLGSTVSKKLFPALNIITTALKTAGYTNCCQNCGIAEGSTYYAYNAPVYLCDSCAAAVSTANEHSIRENELKGENTVAGIVGALLGALIGAASILLVGKMGYVASVCGVIMGVCSLKGYELLAGKLSRKGLLISGVIMVLSVILSYNAEISMFAAAEDEINGFFDYFRAVNAGLFTNGLVWSNYLPGLLKLAVFTAIGAVPTVTANSKRQKSLNVFYKMDKTEAVTADAED